MDLTWRQITFPFLALTISLSFGVVAAQASTAPTGTVPGSLITIEQQAEDIIDIAPSGAWEKVGKDVAIIIGAWKTYHVKAAEAGAAQATVDSFVAALTQLQSATTSQNAVATMQAANDISAALMDLFDLYHPMIPADIGRLDVLERQIILDLTKDDFAAAAASLATAIGLWEQVKPAVVEHEGSDAAAQFDTSLSKQAELLTAKDTAALTEEARNGLEIVDRLERVF